MIQRTTTKITAVSI